MVVYVEYVWFEGKRKREIQISEWEYGGGWMGREGGLFVFALFVTVLFGERVEAFLSLSLKGHLMQAVSFQFNGSN